MKPKTTLRIIQFLLVALLCSQIYSWTTNINNTSIAYNKYETFLGIKERDIKASNDIDFIKNEASENIKIIRNTNRQMHKVSNAAVFIIIPTQGVLVILILLLSFGLKFGKSGVISKTATNIHPVLTNID